MKRELAGILERLESAIVRLAVIQAMPLMGPEEIRATIFEVVDRDLAEAKSKVDYLLTLN